MLSIKGLDSNKIRDENNIRYLVFSLTSNKHDLSYNKDVSPLNEAKDIFYSVSLITSKILDENDEKK
jgi:hypothetical protein